MLSVKDLVKIYKTKGGVEVHALDGVSVDFPETGMVFLLGRSGSGKSTLLNVIGGLDKPTSGEITVKGKSSKDFTSADFDSYRNTFVGFVFQEYNILEEFTVEQNIAIALQLQNKPAPKEAVSDILEMVDLNGVQKRKPRTLSGGQRQRIAIARALIKDPKIIMADEPTGALDSTTGTQIFDTLKKLSKDRLVIVVSHDRGFAEQYGDRIIELADGKVISDISKTATIVTKDEKNVKIINEQTITVKDWNTVTESDLKQILSTMQKSGKETVITANPDNLPEIKKLSGIEEDKPVYSFKDTENITVKDYSNDQTKLIKSRLPTRHALRLAFDGIKTKPIRLAFTILLAVVAFVFFGVSSSLMMYDPNYSIANALNGSNYESIVLNKTFSATYEKTILNADNNSYDHIEDKADLRAAFSNEDLERLNNNTQNLNFAGIIDFGVYETELGNVIGYRSIKPSIRGVVVSYKYDSYFPSTSLLGFSDCGEDYLLNSGFTKLAGRYPLTPTEIAIPNYIFDLFAHANPDFYQDDFKYEKPSDIIDKQINIDDKLYTVVGVYDVGKLPERYDELLNPDSQLDAISKAQLSYELNDIVSNTFHTVIFVSNNFYDAYKNDKVMVKDLSLNGIFFSFETIDTTITDDRYEASVYTDKNIWKYDYIIDAIDLNGNPIDYVSPKENEIYLPIQRAFITPTTDDSDFYTKMLYNGEYRELYPRFYELYDIYRVNTNNLSIAETKEFLKILLTTYKEVIGKELTFPTKVYAKNSKQNEVILDVKGFYIFNSKSMYNDYNYLVSYDFCSNHATLPEKDGYNSIVYKSNYDANPLAEKYGSIITPTKNLTEQTYYILNQSTEDITLEMTNLIYQTTSQMADLIFGLKILFWIAGGVFGLFAALMLFNFITVSISSKNKEIGILRAVGARRADVFKIFIIEALIITLICFSISAVLSGFACNLINTYTLENALKITILDYSFINVLLLLGISFVVSLLATVIPVTKAANKSPVDSIRSL